MIETLHATKKRNKEPFNCLETVKIIKFGHKIDEHLPYLCGHNLFLTDPLRDASPGVPIDRADVHKLCMHFYKNAFNITKLPMIEIACEPLSPDLAKCNLQRVSPGEQVHALIFACARDARLISQENGGPDCLPKDADSKARQNAILDQWVQVFTSMPTRFRPDLSTESEKFFASVRDMLTQRRMSIPKSAK